MEKYEFEKEWDKMAYVYAFTFPATKSTNSVPLTISMKKL
jgi:hypothetical protein